MTTEAPPRPRITEPGVYEIDEATYHQDPVPEGSLSVSGAKKLLPPSCPAIFEYDRRHRRAPSRPMELGTAAHKLVLGVGQALAVIEAKDWRTNKAKDAAEAAREAGQIPLLTAEHEQVQAMAAAIRSHPLASALLTRGDVQPEQSVFWYDDDFGIWRRGRFDAIRPPHGRLVIADYKTAASADPVKFGKAAADLGYHMQDPWYRDGAEACFGEPAVFVFVVQEKEPPYLVTVCELEPEAVACGRARNRRAMEIYRDCTDAGAWPAYTEPGEIAQISLPPWAYREDYL